MSRNATLRIPDMFQKLKTNTKAEKKFTSNGDSNPGPSGCYSFTLTIQPHTHTS